MQEKLLRVIMLIKDGRKIEARILLQQMLAADPRDEQAWLWYVECLQRPEEAIAALETCLRANPMAQTARQNLRALRREHWRKNDLGRTQPVFIDNDPPQQPIQLELEGMGTTQASAAEASAAEAAVAEAAVADPADAEAAAVELARAEAGVMEVTVVDRPVPQATVEEPAYGAPPVQVEKSREDEDTIPPAPGKAPRLFKTNKMRTGLLIFTALKSIIPLLGL